MLALRLALIPVNMAIGLFTLSCLWHWFAVPLGAPSLGYFHLWGLSLLASWPVLGLFVTVHMHQNERLDKDTRDLAIMFGSTLVMGWWLLMGAIAHAVAF